jgi:very-short-patch-repair endonuclease
LRTGPAVVHNLAARRSPPCCGGDIGSMEPLLVAIAAAQCGVFSRAQALAAGYSEERIRHLLAVGSWLRCHPGIYCLAGVARSFDMNAWIAVLAAGQGALLSRLVAGKLHGLAGTPQPVHFDLAVPAHRHPRGVPRAKILRTELAPDDIAVCRGFPVTSLVRTLVDLGASLPLEIGSRVMADALRLRRTSVAAIELKIAALSGHTGIDRARRALASTDPKLESVLEGELLALLRRAGLNPIAQYVVTAGGNFIARVDFALPNIRLAIEADGYDTHAQRPGFERDREKSALLQLAGWNLLSFTALQIRQQPERVIDTVLKRIAQLSESGSADKS